MTRVAVNPKILEWAAERSDNRPGELVEKFPKLGRWLSGDEEPTLHQLELFSKATSTPLGFLFLDKPPVERLPIPHYRTVTDKAVSAPSPGLLATIYMMQRRQAWLREFLIDEGQEPVRLVKCAKPSERPLTVAERLRRQLSLNATWASEHGNWVDAQRALRDAMGNAGIVVVINGIVGNNTHRALDVEEFRGFVLVDEYAPLVFVNGADAKSAQMFTLAHELAHVAFGSSAAFDLRQMQAAGESTEQACNAVAAEFLVPEALLRDLWKPGDSYDAVARAFKVSQVVAARRLLDLRLITRKEFFAFYREQMAHEHRQKEVAESGANFYATAAQRVGTRFAVELVRALREGRVLHTEAYRLTGMTGPTFEEFARRVQKGGVG
jgi:Zn-dependent peptidase ImmA (M78 family)